jgi:hypothetical protein
MAQNTKKKSKPKKASAKQASEPDDIWREHRRPPDVRPSGKDLATLLEKLPVKSPLPEKLRGWILQHLRDVPVRSSGRPELWTGINISDTNIPQMYKSALKQIQAEDKAERARLRKRGGTREARAPAHERAAIIVLRQLEEEYGKENIEQMSVRTLRKRLSEEGQLPHSRKKKRSDVRRISK